MRAAQQRARALSRQQCAELFDNAMVTDWASRSGRKRENHGD
jgi:hypothetical protein